MNVKLLSLMCFGAFVLSVSYAQEFASIASSDAELKQAAASQAVQQELIQDPDGVEIQVDENGAFQIFSRGTGTYDFNDPDDIREAFADATKRAKANIAKFMKEKVTTEDGLEQVSKKVKSQTGDGNTQSTSVSKESVKTAYETIVNSSEAILTGVITLTQTKQPRGNNGGEVQVTVGISSKTLKAAQSTARGINDSLSNRGAGQGGMGGGGAAPQPPQPNDGYIRRSKTAF